MKKDMKMFGLKRTGTNWLLQLLGMNYHVTWFINEGGWKHGRYRVKELLGRHMDSVVLVKNIYSWLVSMHRYRGLWGNEDFGEFVQDGQFIDLWNLQNRNWLETINDIFPMGSQFRMLIIRYEDLLADPQSTCEYIAREIGLVRKRKLKKFIIETKRMGRSGRPAHKQFTRGAYYLKKKYMGHYTPKMLDVVRGLVDKDLAKEFGYVIE
jgi:hypothetical protein